MRSYLCVVDTYELPTDYDDYYFAGDYCVNAIKWCQKNHKQYQILYNQELQFEDIHKMYLYLEKVQDKVLVYLADILNDYHKSDYSIYKWNILLNNWLRHFIPSVYDKYLTMKKISSEKRQFYLELYDTSYYEPVLDQLEFMNVLSDDFGFHQYEYSVLIKCMSGIGNIKFIDCGKYKKICFRKYDFGKLPKYVEDFVWDYQSYKERIKENDEMVIQSLCIKFTLYKEIMESKYGKISGYFKNYLSEIRNSINGKENIDVLWRNKERSIVEEDEFVSIVCKVVCKFIPMAYIEQFSYIRELALDNYRWGMNPKVLLFDMVGVATNELFKIYMMNIDVENIKKVDIMHAPPYDIGGYYWGNLGEFQLCDDFLISGGIRHKKISTNFIQMPFIGLFRRNITIEKGNKIIYVNYTYPQHKIRLSLAEWNWGRFVKKELEFFKLLDKETISEMRFRPHPGHKNQWNSIQKIKNEISELVFDNVPDFYTSIRDAKLVVSEILGAAAMESIGLGKPTIVLFNPMISYVELNDNYKDVEDMIRVGMIAETPERLASIVNSIHDDVDSWWNEPERQEVFRRIQEKYMYFPENAKELWVEKIRSYVE